MSEKEMVGKIEDTIYWLYQNRAEEGIQMVVSWLTMFQSFLGDCESVKNPEIRSFGILMIRELLEAYQAHDVIGMADCMAEKSILFVKAYFQNLKVEGSEG